LTPEQVRELKRFARREVGRVAERAFMVLLASRGLSAPEVARLLDDHPDTVRHWLQRYQAEGLEGLRDRPRSGRPPKAGADARAQIRQLLQTSPAEQGYPHNGWTVPLLVHHLQIALGLILSTTTVRRLLHALSYVWRRAKLGPPRMPDPEAAAKLEAIQAALEEAAQPGSTVHVLYEDETHIQLLPLVRAMWRRRGQPPSIPTPGTNRKFSVFGALNVATGAWHYLIRDHQRAEHFIEFLEQLLTAYPTGRIILILDNAAIHFCKRVKAWLADHPQVTLLPLPRYSPHLNRVELVWKVLKDAVAANRAYTDVQVLKETVRQFFEHFRRPPVIQAAAA
jgi:transposase